MFINMTLSIFLCSIILASLPYITATHYGPPASPLDPSQLGLSPSNICLVGGTDPIPFLVNGAPALTCPEGYYCPKLNASDATTALSYCQPTSSCQLNRLSGTFCTYQGYYEPLYCPGGFYCPIGGQSIIACPSGHYCPGGRSEPISCSQVSSCPSGSESELYYGGVIIIIIIDLAIVALYHLRSQYLYRAAANVAQTPTDVDAAPSKSPDASSVALVNAFAKARMSAPVQSLQFKFEHLSLTVPIPDAPPKQVLADVSGILPKAAVTAIMGPSGAGKTTFLNTLLGKVSTEWKRTGILSLNGQNDDDISRYRKLIGFVSQDDIMQRQLTVQENIEYSARMRLPASWTVAEKVAHSEAVIGALNLRHVKYSRIGDEVSRGVSGGQRKRVSIGMEMAAAPLALFLDEPTTGLDSTSALEVTTMLKDIARATDLTVAMVIHQPRREIWNALDQVLLLAPGGRTVYCGAQHQCVTYFERRFDLQFNPRDNPADAIIDAIALQGDEFVQAWTNGGHEYLLHLDEKSPSNNNNNNIETMESFKTIDLQQQIESVSAVMYSTLDPSLSTNSTMTPVTIMSPKKVSSHDRGATFLEQIYLSHNRSLQQQIANWSSFTLEAFVIGLVGIILGLSGSIAWQGALDDPWLVLGIHPTTELTVEGPFYICIGVTLSGGVAAVGLFGDVEQLVYWREAASGYNRLAYFIGINIAFIWRMIIIALHFTAVFMLTAVPVTSFVRLWGLSLLLFWNAYGLASIIISLFPRSSHQIAIVVIGVIFCITNGHATLIPLGLDYLTPSFWFTEAYYTSQTQPFADVMNIAADETTWGFSVNRDGLDVGMMLAWGFVYRIIGYICMITRNTFKQV